MVYVCAAAGGGVRALLRVAVIRRCVKKVSSLFKFRARMALSLLLGWRRRSKGYYRVLFMRGCHLDSGGEYQMSRTRVWRLVCGLAPWGVLQTTGCYKCKDHQGTEDRTQTLIIMRIIIVFM